MMFWKLSSAASGLDPKLWTRPTDERRHRLAHLLLGTAVRELFQILRKTLRQPERQRRTLRRQDPILREQLSEPPLAPVHHPAAGVPPASSYAAAPPDAPTDPPCALPDFPPSDATNVIRPTRAPCVAFSLKRATDPRISPIFSVCAPSEVTCRCFARLKLDRHLRIGPEPTTLFATPTDTSNSSPGATTVGTFGLSTKITANQRFLLQYTDGYQEPPQPPSPAAFH